ncbi:MAG: flagellar biosynthetic protein FliO [Hungatella sp.]
MGGMDIAQIKDISSYVIVLILFVLILYASYICSKKVAKISQRTNNSKYMKLVDRLMLGQDRCLAIVSIGEKYYAVGITAAGINLMTELESDDLIELEPPGNSFPENLNFKDIMNQLRRNKHSQD